MIKDSVNQLKHRLQQTSFDEDISDECAYVLYQIADTLFDWVLKEFDIKIKRFLLHCHGIDIKDDYDPRRSYDDGYSGNDDPPF